MPLIDILKLVITIYIIGIPVGIHAIHVAMPFWDEKFQGPRPQNIFKYAVKRSLMWPILLFKCS